MKKIVSISAIILVVAAFLLLHSTPKLAICTNVFLMGYPKEALTSEVEEYEFYNEVDENNFVEQNPHSKFYILSNPPIEKATEGELNTYKVRKFGFLYFAEFYVNI